MTPQILQTNPPLEVSFRFRKIAKPNKGDIVLNAQNAFMVWKWEYDEEIQALPLYDMITHTPSNIVWKSKYKRP